MATRAAILAISVLLAATPRAVWAQDHKPQPLQELFLTEVVYPQDKGEIQFTVATLVDRSRADRAALTPLSIEYGLTDRWQVEASWSGYTRFVNAPFANLRTDRTSVGTKYSFMNIAHSPVHVAVGLDAEFPHAGVIDDGGEDSIEIEPVVSAAIDCPRRITVFGSAGASFSPREAAAIAGGDKPEDAGTLGLGALIAFSRATVALEYTNRSDNLPWRLDGSPLVTPSIVVHPGGEWEVGFGMPTGVRNGSRRPGLAFHLIKEFN